ncbi:MAG: glycosyltransferase family 4 protein [Verrucomicrobiota bacterium]
MSAHSVKLVKFLAVCQVFHPDPQATGQLFFDLFRRLAHQGHQIKVLCGFPATQQRVFKKEYIQRLEIQRCGLKVDFKKNLFLRAVHYFAYVFSASIHLFSARNYDFVLGLTNPPFTPVWLWMLSKFCRFRYQLMLLDIYPDGLEALGFCKNPLYRLWRALNKRAFHDADKILVLGRDMKELLQARYKVSSSKIFYAPHWSPFQNSQPVSQPEQSSLWRELYLEDKFVVQYSGNMGLWHDIETIVRGAELLQHEPRIHFLMIGDGRRKHQAHRLAQNLNLKNITWVPFQPKEKLVDSLACCHAALISQNEGLQGVAVPCKLYGILASARPIIALAPSDSEIARVLKEEQCGIIVPPHDPKALASTVYNFFKSYQNFQPMGAKSFTAYRSKYTLEAATENFREIWGLTTTGSMPDSYPTQPISF